MIVSIIQTALNFFPNLFAVNKLRWFCCPWQGEDHHRDTTTNILYFEIELSSSSDIYEVKTYERKTSSIWMKMNNSPRKC